jgi:hypothetical protein
MNGKPPAPGVTGTDGKGNPLKLNAYSDSSFGFLRVTINAQSILVESVGVAEPSGKTSSLDSFTVNLAQHTVSDGGAASGRRASAGGGPKPKPGSKSRPSAPPRGEVKKKKKR